MVVISTSKGDIRLELDEEGVPITVENFLNYVNSGFYNQSIFHRVISGFMIQGGGFDTKMEQNPTKNPIKNEAKTGQSNKRGTIAMARTMDPDSATAQFFINLVDNHFLDPSDQGFGYCVFGKVVEGMDVVDAIAAVKTGQKSGHTDVPLEEVLIMEIKEV